ncbi:hypothetical protein ACR0ST_07445 [Aliidiomarina sp. Khilg15.8]
MRLYATLMTLALVGCTLPTTQEEARLSAEQRLAQAYARPAPAQASQHVIYEQGYFVPPLAKVEVEGPDWFQHNVEFAFENYALEAALRDMLQPAAVNLHLLDTIDGQQPVSLRYQGSLGGAIEQLSLVTGLHFTPHPHVLTARRFEMAEFDVAFLAGSTHFFLGEDGERRQPASTRSAGPVATSVVSEESSQFLNFSSEAVSVWDDLERALALLLSTEGQVVLNQSSTSVLVRDYPQHVQQVRDYLLQQNRRLTRQVAVDVQVIDIAFNDEDQVGIDWDLVYESASSSGIVNFSSGLLNSLHGDTGSRAGLRRTSGRFSGSRALISALSEQGVVEVSSHPRLVSLNNQIAKIVLEDNATYLASAGSNATANVGSSDILIPGVVTTGFELYVLPKVANSQVVMQLSTSLSDLKGIDEVTSGETTIQTPSTNRKKFFMKAMVGDGETLLISGLKSSRQQWQQQRTLGSWLFGGRREARQQRSETLLLLTPRILETGAML